MRWEDIAVTGRDKEGGENAHGLCIQPAQALGIYPPSVPAPLGCGLSWDNAARPGRSQLNVLPYTNRDSLFCFRKHALQGLN